MISILALAMAWQLSNQKRELLSRGLNLRIGQTGVEVRTAMGRTPDMGRMTNGRMVECWGTKPQAELAFRAWLIESFGWNAWPDARSFEVEVEYDPTERVSRIRI